MTGYYAFMSLDMVMPDQVEALKRSLEGVVGWRYRPARRILDLLFETDVETEQARLDAMAAGQTVYLVLDAQRGCSTFQPGRASWKRSRTRWMNWWKTR